MVIFQLLQSNTCSKMAACKNDVLILCYHSKLPTIRMTTRTLILYRASLRRAAHALLSSFLLSHHEVKPSLKRYTTVLSLADTCKILPSDQNLHMDDLRQSCLLSWFEHVLISQNTRLDADHVVVLFVSEIRHSRGLFFVRIPDDTGCRH